MIKKFKKPISRAIVSRLILIGFLGLLVTSVLSYLNQTKIARDSVYHQLLLTLEDIRQSVVQACDDDILLLASNIAGVLDEQSGIPSRELLDILAKANKVSEINIVSSKGIIVQSTKPEYLNFNMYSGSQSSEFNVLISDTTKFAQVVGSISYDPSIQMKYAGVRLKNGGYVQVGYDYETFLKDVAYQLEDVTLNRRIGERGCIIIINEKGDVVSAPSFHKNDKIFDIAEVPENLDLSIYNGKLVKGRVYGEMSYGVPYLTSGYFVAAIIPVKEAMKMQTYSFWSDMLLEVILLAVLLLLIFAFIRRSVVKNISKIALALHHISSGELDENIQVRDYLEFSNLSDDINHTVDVLKGYIEEASTRMDRELELARRIQASCLPSIFPPFPSKTEFDIFAAMTPAKEVGGDFYDFYFVSHARVLFIVADVSGKGVPAAMFMMTAKALVKSCAQTNMALNEMATKVNNELCAHNDAGMFVTCWIGILNIETGELEFVNAGHNLPLICRQGGDFEYFRSKADLPFAAMEDYSYSIQKTTLYDGERMFLYTDGVTEATNLSQQLYGEDRLRDFLNSHKGIPGRQLCDGIKYDIDTFVGEAPQFDDITMLCLDSFVKVPESQKD